MHNLERNLHLQMALSFRLSEYRVMLQKIYILKSFLIWENILLTITVLYDYHVTISSSIIPFFSHLQSFPASGSFQISQLFPSGGQSIGVAASTSVLPKNIQDWFPLGWSGRISLQSKGLSRVFSNTTVQKHQFFGTQLFFIDQLSHPYMTTGKTIALTRWTFFGKVMRWLYGHH